MARPFLSERAPRPLPGQGELEPEALHIGGGQNAFEVAAVDSATLSASQLNSHPNFQFFASYPHLLPAAPLPGRSRRLRARTARPRARPGSTLV